MADIVTQTINQAGEATDILDTDWHVMQRGDAPAQKIAHGAVRQSVAEQVAAEFPESHLAEALAAVAEAGEKADDAAAWAGAASDDADAAEIARGLTVAASERAIMAAATSLSYPNSAATAVPRGVTSINLTAPGNGYTNGTDFVGVLTGGGGSAARFLFDVVGGAVTNLHGLEPGYGFTGNPTGASFATAGAGTGATVAAVASHLVPSGKFYWAASANGATESMYQNNAGAPLLVTPEVKRPYAGQIPATAAASSSVLWDVTPEFPVVGLGQKIRAIAPGNNGAGQLKIGAPNLFGGVRTDVILPTGEPVPQNHIRANYPFEFTPAVIGGNNRLILTFPPYIPDAQKPRLQWMGPLGYNLGSAAIVAGNTITGEVSGVTAVVISVPDAEATGVPWDGTRAGTLYVETPAAFIAGENLLVGGVVKAKATGPVSLTAAMSARIASPGQTLPTGLYGPEFDLRVPTPKLYGSPSIKIYANDGVTVILPAAQIRLSDDVTIPLAANYWLGLDQLRLSRSKVSNQMNLLKGPDNTLNTVTEALSSRLNDMPPRQAQILLTRDTQKRIHIASANLAYDDASKRMNQDVHHTLLVDLAEGMSQTAYFKSATAWAVNSEWAEVEGRTLRYSALSSDDMGAGVYDTLQPSIMEPVGYFGLITENLGENFVGGAWPGKTRGTDIGLGHGNARLVSTSMQAECFVGFAGPWTWQDVAGTAAPGRKRARALTLTQTFDALRRTQTGVECIGQVTFSHMLSYQWAGWRLYAQTKFGASMAYTDYGPTVIAEGATITGATSGATARIAVIPAAEITSGTIAAGTAAGRWNVTDVVGTFVAGETLTVGGVARAKAGGPAGPRIAVLQNFGHMLIATTVNEAKVAGLPAQATGFERPSSDDLTGPGAGKYTQPHGQGSRAQFRHTNVPDVIYELVNVDGAWAEVASPMTPDGYPAGQGPLSGFWVQDREEGVRKFYNSPYTGALGAQPFDGIKEFRAIRRFRRGALV
ncbi:hypothetical protein [Brevundimonas sp.]|uniref:hypothetical protein n=1 Tax=Brevundimonas sp. TaxID=1871086 RepID=UPI003F70DC46